MISLHGDEEGDSPLCTHKKALNRARSGILGGDILIGHCDDQAVRLFCWRGTCEQAEMELILICLVPWRKM